MKIYCPNCSWRPPPSARWICRPGCEWLWNTFETHGQCPNCFKQWKLTKCFQCKEWSPHDDWYHEEEPVQTEKHEVAVAA